MVAGRPRLDHPRRRRPAPRRGHRQAGAGDARPRRLSGRRARRSGAAPAGDAQPPAQRHGSDGRRACSRATMVSVRCRRVDVRSGRPFDGLRARPFDGLRARPGHGQRYGPGPASPARKRPSSIPSTPRRRTAWGWDSRSSGRSSSPTAARSRAANHERGGAVFEFTLAARRLTSTRRSSGRVMRPSFFRMNAPRPTRIYSARASSVVRLSLREGSRAHTVCICLRPSSSRSVSVAATVATSRRAAGRTSRSHRIRPHGRRGPKRRRGSWPRSIDRSARGWRRKRGSRSS